MKRLIRPFAISLLMAATLLAQTLLAQTGSITGHVTDSSGSILQGAHIVRVHDVEEMVQVARVTDCVLHPGLRPRNAVG